MNTVRFQQVVAAAQVGLETSINEFMPSCTYRDFYLWALSPASPHQDRWLQLIGAVQIAGLTVQLFDGLLADDGEWQALASGSTALTVYLVCEAMSDDLGLYLAYRRANDPTYGERFQLVQEFNEAMSQFAQDTSLSVEYLIGGLRDLAGSTSLFEQKLLAKHHRRIAEGFIAQHPAVNISDLEYSLWPILVTNMQAMGAVIDRMEHSEIATLLREGLIERYQSVNRVMGGGLDLDLRAEVGAYTILVLPTLAYYVSLYAETIRPLDNLSAVLADGSLYDALYDASLLSRLLNDLGSLVLASSSERSAMFETLQKDARMGAYESLSDVFRQSDSRYGPMLTRFQKDVVYGEFNMALDDLRDVLPVTDVLTTIAERVDYFARLYQECRLQFSHTLDFLDNRLGDEGVSTIIRRFVLFHEGLYSHRHTELSGEYTI